MASVLEPDRDTEIISADDFEETIRNGNLEDVKRLIGLVSPLITKFCTTAARYGHLEILKYLHDNNCPWDECACAAGSGHFEILEYLHNNSCPWDERACALAAANGHFEILKYLHNNNCPWDKWACEYAAGNGHFEILEYLHTNGCPCKHKKYNFDFFNHLSITNVKDDECYICKSNYAESNEDIYIFPCHRSHIYHKSCYTKWVETCKKNECVFGCSNGPK